MATNNMRIVGYLPPAYHQKLREYMEQESLTESAALVKIVKQFFDGTTETEAPEAAKEKDDALAEFKADIALTQAAFDGSGAGRGGETTTIQI